jgi:NADH-quinone oxidoreductase subunit C
MFIDNTNSSSYSLVYISSYTDIIESSTYHITTYRQTILEAATILKLSSILNCNIAIDALVIDNVNHEYRFTVIYLLQSSVGNVVYRLSTKVTDFMSLLSLQSIFPGFNWSEREIWDLYGIFFIKHPDLRRILTDYGFAGHPLRKDFPISGFREVHYDDTLKQIVYNNTELSQNFRIPEIDSIWIYA